MRLSQAGLGASCGRLGPLYSNLRTARSAWDTCFFDSMLASVNSQQLIMALDVQSTQSKPMSRKPGDANHAVYDKLCVGGLEYKLLS
eukprot:1874664-Pyramimonas_sp.AAC.1